MTPSVLPQPARTLSAIGLDIGFAGRGSLWSQLKVAPGDTVCAPSTCGPNLVTPEVLAFCEALPHLISVSDSQGNYLFANAWVEAYVGRRLTTRKSRPALAIPMIAWQLVSLGCRT